MSLSAEPFTLAARTAMFTAWAAVVDARHASALVRALGATPRQVRTGLADAQLLSALPGVIVGVPLGFALFERAAGVWVVPSVLWLVATVLGTSLVVAAVTSVPARIGTRRPVAEVLQEDAA